MSPWQQGIVGEAFDAYRRLYVLEEAGADFLGPELQAAEEWLSYVESEHRLTSADRPFAGAVDPFAPIQRI